MEFKNASAVSSKTIQFGNVDTVGGSRVRGTPSVFGLPRNQQSQIRFLVNKILMCAKNMYIYR